MSQRAFVETLLSQHGFTPESNKTTKTPYRSGFLVDKITSSQIPPHQQHQLESVYRSMVGSFNWLAQSTRPDLATITSILSQYLHRPTPGHIGAARHVLHYLNGTKDLEIAFHSNKNFSIQSFVHFPINGKIQLAAAADANWGPQDQSVPALNDNSTVDLFKTRSISGHILALHGRVHWSSKRQGITARSSAEAQIYATDRCVRDIQHLSHIIKDLKLHDTLLSQPVKVLNNNMACIMWAGNKTNRNLQHLQINKNVVRKSIQSNTVEILHIPGSVNLSDIFTKEDRDSNHFLSLRNVVLSKPFSSKL